MPKNDDITAYGKKFDFDRVLANAPDAGDALRATGAAVAAGDLIRRVRNRMVVSQTALAKRIGTTQPHISDVERGLGENGPTVGMLSRLLRALGDDLLVQSHQEQAMAQHINAAEVAVGEPTEKIVRDRVTEGSDGLAGILRTASVELVRRDSPDLSTRQQGVFMTCYLDSEAQTVRSLAAKLNVSTTAITRVLDRLSRFDLVRRKIDPLDRRSVLVQRTATGMAFMRELRTILRDAASTMRITAEQASTGRQRATRERAASH
jgi:DNA-binding MarR family transcriptional regulator/DNA-binding XRE family transcriptional regulator